MNKPLIIVTGRNGQLGLELMDLPANYPQFAFIFFDKEALNIADVKQVQIIFELYSPAYFINCAAYTAVDKAETEKEKALQINAEAVGNIAAFCRAHHTRFIHISTDYIFDGNATVPYKEDDITDPVNYYGYTKLEGEQLAMVNNPESLIIRTSWVYSSYGNNFVKTMLRLMKERNEISVVDDQTGSPTYAADLAETIMEIIDSVQLSASAWHGGIYHYSNEGAITWYDFACAIKEIKKLTCIIHPIKTTQYPTPAKRPFYTVMNKGKIAETFGITIKNWRTGLERCLQKI